MYELRARIGFIKIDSKDNKKQGIIDYPNS